MSAANRTLCHGLMASSLAAVLGALFCFLLFGCASSREAVTNTAEVHLSISPSFIYRPGMRVTVLPFTVTGNPNKERDISEADILCLRLREAEFVIIDSTLFQKHDLLLSHVIPEYSPAAVQGALHIDLMVFGTINCSFSPSFSSLFSKGTYAPSSGSVRFVDVATGEVVIIASTGFVRGSLAAGIAEAVIQALQSRSR